MLSKRLTEPRRVVSMLDPAMRQIDPKKRIAYSHSRMIEDLGDLSALAEPFAVFTITPMLPKYQHLAGMLHMLFSFHCIKVEGCHITPADFETKDGAMYMKQESMETLPLDSVLELGQVILDLASVDGATSPFSSPVSDWQDRIREADRQTAMRAAMGIAAKLPGSKPPATPKSQTDSGTEPNGPQPQSPSETPGDSSSPVPTT